MQITESLKRQFNQAGYLTVRGLFKTDEVDCLLHRAKADKALLDEAYSKRDSEGGESKLAVRNELDDSPYAAIVRSERVANNMQFLLGDEVYHYHHKMMLKEPRVGGAWEWHQDYGYWYHNGCLFPDMASCMIAVDRASRENGCLQVIPGSHMLGRIEHQKTGEQTGANLQRVEVALEKFGKVYCELEPGDAVFFHSNTLHRSDCNRSDLPRWSLICCYNTKHNDPIFESKHPRYHPLEIWSDARVRETLLAGSA